MCSDVAPAAPEIVEPSTQIGEGDEDEVDLDQPDRIIEDFKGVLSRLVTEHKAINKRAASERG